MLNIAVLASTSGTDLQVILDKINDGSLKNVALKCVISNKEDCFALERTRNAGFLDIYLDPKGKSREEYDREIAKVLEDHEVDLIIMIGYMKYTSDWFVEKYRNRNMNIHPSLLPAFGGKMDLDVHQEILDHGCKVTGCTLHFATEELDNGPIIIQKVVRIAEDETKDTLKEKVQKSEQEAIIEGIELYRDGKITVEGRKVLIRN